MTEGITQAYLIYRVSALLKLNITIMTVGIRINKNIKLHFPSKIIHFYRHESYDLNVNWAICNKDIFQDTWMDDIFIFCFISYKLVQNVKKKYG